LFEQKFFSGTGLKPKLIEVKALALIDTLLRNREQFFAEVQQSTGLLEKMRILLTATFIALALYGVLLGSTHSLWQSASSAVKLPLLFLTTLLICTPVLYILNILFGANQRLSQSIVLALASISLTAILLLSLAPVTLFFILTAPNSYQFFKLLNVLFFTTSGIIGTSCLRQGIKIVWADEAGVDGAIKSQSLMFWLWLISYSFVGSQVAWTIRPFVGYPGVPFEVFRQFGGNFYTNILTSLGEILGFIIVK
jgi:hypothetical protein